MISGAVTHGVMALLVPARSGGRAPSGSVRAHGGADVTTPSLVPTVVCTAALHQGVEAVRAPWHRATPMARHSAVPGAVTAVGPPLLAFSGTPPRTVVGVLNTQQGIARLEPGCGGCTQCWTRVFWRATTRHPSSPRTST